MAEHEIHDGSRGLPGTVPMRSDDEFEDTRRPTPSTAERVALRLLKRQLRGLSGGTFCIELPDGQEVRAGSGEPVTKVTVHDFALLRRVLLRGEVGLGEAYVEGLWDTPDLVQAAETFLGSANQPPLAGRVLGSPFRILEATAHAARSNTRRRSKRNIVAHYDEGHDFFRLMLGPSMTYSCAVFGSPDEELDAAQERKLEMIAAKLDVERAAAVLDIGCGFGSFALHMARTRGSRVDACTISPSQAERARERTTEAGLDEDVRIIEADYRTLPSRRRQYAGIASIGMYEHVGRRHQRQFWRIAASLLEPGGRIALQTIVRTSPRPGPVSWIQKHVFPGGYLPALPELCSEAMQEGRLRVIHAEEIGPHYATTLRRWRRNLLAGLAGPNAPEMPEERKRHWLYFLSTCEAAFRTGTVSNYQIVLARD